MTKHDLPLLPLHTGTHTRLEKLKTDTVTSMEGKTSHKPKPVLGRENPQCHQFLPPQKKLFRKNLGQELRTPLYLIYFTSRNFPGPKQ